MSTDLESMLGELAARWESEAPVISTAAVMLASRAPLWSDEIVVEHEQHRSPRRHGALIAVAATVVVVAVVIAVLDSRRDSSPIGPAPDTTTGAVPTVAETAAPTSTTEVPATTVPPSETFAEMAAARAAALAAFESLSFTATVSEEYDGQPELTSSHTNEVVLRNDGSLWATGDTVLMNSFDAQTGVARLHFVQQDGSVAYQEVVGWTDNSVPLMTMLGGVDPTGPVDVIDGATIEEATINGRAVWRVVRTTAMDNNEQTDTWTVDRATGLIVGYGTDWVYDGAASRARRSVVLSDVVLGAQLPPEFPGSFPEGAVVDRSGDPNGFRPVTVAEAATEFGDGFVVPADLAGDARITITTYDSSLSDPTAVAAGSAAEVLAPTVNVEILTRVGFTRTVINLTKMRPPLIGSVPDGYLVVGDALCRSSDGTTCEAWSDESLITSGAWAGASSSLWETGLSAERDGVSLSINAPTPGETVRIANSLMSV